jgi:DNA-binding response OmpR family regulator
MIAAVWREAASSPDDALHATDEQNVRKLIARIRARLEPDATPGTWRFIRNARGRGYWLSLS